MDEVTRSLVIQNGDDLALEFERAVLLVEEGPEAGLEHPLADRPLVLGRGESADLRIPDPAVSREHLRLEPAGTGWRVLDLGSKSGTFVDDLKVTEAEVGPDRRIRFGETVVVIRVRRDRVAGAANPARGFPGILGESPALQKTLALVEKVGPLDLPVLLRGESGTGKERLAHALHQRSPRADGPYEVVDCTLLGSGEHLRSELFGHVTGAFTGATEDRTGAFVRAHGGTIFLDEVAEIPLDLQPQLLRVLQEGEVRPLGGDTTRRVRVRVVCASHRDLAEMVGAGTFRQDLFYRISAITLDVPPLRERGKDILLLARHFLPAGKTLASSAEEALARHTWPGNVRELQAAVRQAAALADGPEVGATDLRLRDQAGSAGGGRAQVAGDLMKEQREWVAKLEDEDILRALEKCGGNRNQAARHLGIGRATLFRRLKALKEAGLLPD